MTTTDMTTMVTTIVCTLLGSSALISFFQFLITRKDKKKEDAKKDQFEELRSEFKKGLDDREMTGKQRYDEHRLAIEKMNLEHKKDFQELQKAIQQLTDNDTRIAKSIEEIANKQGTMADGLVGLAHDKIIFLTNKIAERGAVTLQEKATLESMYKPYKKLGGNGHCQKAWEYVETLPVVSIEKAKEMDKERTNSWQV